MRWSVLAGDCRALMGAMGEASVDAIVTDPPYGLAFMGKGWDHAVPGVDFWTAALRVAKPGAHLVAFGGTRTFHRLTCAIEDAGWEIRDCLIWLYGSGFPKSMDVSKAIDKQHGNERGKRGSLKSGNAAMKSPNYERTPKGTPIAAEAAAWDGYGTALKPAWEPVILARKPIKGTVAANVQKHGTGGINVDGCRLPCGDEHFRGEIKNRNIGTWAESKGMHTPGRGFVATDSPLGRWPANVLLDEEAAEGLGEESRYFYTAKASRSEREEGLEWADPKLRNDGRSADHDTPNLRTNHHPTVKPVDLMGWLCRLVTRPGGTILDPFTGSGSTGVAAIAGGFNFIGCEIEPEYVAIARARIAGTAPLFAREDAGVDAEGRGM